MTETDAPRQANIFASMKRGARVAFMGAALFLAARAGAGRFPRT